FAFNNGNEIPMTLDNRTNDLTAALEWTHATDGMFRVAYDGSWFNNAFTSLTWDNPLRATDYTHSAKVLGSLDNFVAVNSAVEVDLTGQVNAEIANGSYVGAVGGALDFIRAANASPGGASLICLPASIGTKLSRVVAKLSGPVATPRSEAGVFVTEHGVADLRGVPLAERPAKMIAIAHPAFREALEREAHGARNG
ncbi:MAG: MtrB/PioB family outer membrane beta-barrel protein, partial [Proteobacteria bacterium]|nr:MtrB/PioB family outer membrane beta-barrel protein [Pseudomonadota bacterium]